MVIKITSPKIILNWLKRNAFKDIPYSLWDKYLWLYNLLLECLSTGISGIDVSKLSLYITKNEDKITGIGLFNTRNEVNTLYFDGLSNLGFEELLSKLINEGYIIKKINVRREENAHLNNKTVNFTLVDSVHKFYTASQPKIDKNTNIITRELTKDDEELYKTSYINNGLTPYEGFRNDFDEGFRYFGGIKDNELVSIACLTRLTVFRSELIAVRTINEENRNKGYSQAVCSLAINEGLKETNVITWTANANNIASIVTAKKLGMKQYDSRFIYKVKR